MRKIKPEIWVVCGAGRGVGKTKIAQGLVDLLHSGVYAKCGHNAKKAGKPDLYFDTMKALNSFVSDCYDKYENIVIESNAYALSGKADFVIYIDGAESATSFRDDCDKLKSLSDIEICSDSTIEKWQRTLKAKLKNDQDVRDMCRLFSAQRRYLFGCSPRIRSKVWFEVDGKHLLGKGLAALLEQIDKGLTLQNAADNVHISYRKAWELISEAEHLLGCKLVVRQSGGKKGGESRLSKKGESLLSAYELTNKEVTAYAKRKFGRFLDSVKTEGI
jgi:molybdate transport system regulatory protein